MSDEWAYYNAEGKQVSPQSTKAVARGKEVQAGAVALAPLGFASLPAVFYVGVHAIGSEDRHNFVSKTRFKAWCKIQKTVPPAR